MTTKTDASRAAIAARVRAEGTITLQEAATLFPAPTPTPTGHVSKATLLRWIVVGRGYYKVRLDGARVKGVWHTSVLACHRFYQATEGPGAAGRLFARGERRPERGPAY